MVRIPPPQWLSRVWQVPERVPPRPVSVVAVLVAALVLLGFAGGASPSPAIAPERPRRFVDTAPVTPPGRRIAVSARGDFQAALNAANPGDVITLQAGATYTGPFTLPAKAGTGWIIVRTSTPDSALPPPGNRIDPSYAPLMPKLVLGWDGNILRTASGAHHVRFIGIDLHPTSGTYIHTLVSLGNDAHDLIFDRCYLHGDPAAGSRQGIEMNSASTAVIDSYFTDFKSMPWRLPAAGS